MGVQVWAQNLARRVSLPKLDPVVVKTWTSSAAQAAGIAMAADLTTQYILRKPSSTDEESVEQWRPDWRRTASFGLFSFAYGGIAQRFIYLAMDRWLGAGVTLAHAVRKVALDALVHAPFMYVPSFYLSTSLMQGKSSEAAVTLLKSKYVDTLMAYMAIWPGLLTFCFRCVPEAHRVVFIAGCGYFEKGIISFIADSA